MGTGRPDLTARLSAQYDGKALHKRPAEIEKENFFFISDVYESGGAALISTVDDYALFTDALACGGVSKDEYRVLTPRSIDQMRTNRLEGASAKDFKTNFSHMPGYGYGLGVRTKIEKCSGQQYKPFGRIWVGRRGRCSGCYRPRNPPFIFLCSARVGRLNPRNSSQTKRFNF